MEEAESATRRERNEGEMEGAESATRRERSEGEMEGEESATRGKRDDGRGNWVDGGSGRKGETNGQEVGVGSSMSHPRPLVPPSPSPLSRPRRPFLGRFLFSRVLLPFHLGAASPSQGAILQSATASTTRSARSPFRNAGTRLA